MSDITKQIKELLGQESLSHSLSKEALARMLEEIRTLDSSCKKLKETNEKLSSEKADLSSKLSSCREANSKLITENKDLKRRETDLEERERACLILEVRNEFEQKRGDEFFQLTNKIFNNRIIRESSIRTFPAKETYTQGADQYGNGANSSETYRDVTDSKTSSKEEA